MNKSLLLSLSLASSLTMAETLTVYTYDSFVSEWGPGPQLEPLFEQQCGCDMEFIASSDAITMLNRARMEGKRTDADVLLGLDNLTLQQAEKEKLVQPHQLSTDHISAHLDWTNKSFMPFDYGYFAWVYNKNEITDPATSFEELIASKASVIYQDPRTSTPGFGLLTWIEQTYGSESEVIWKQLASQTETVTQGWWEAYSLFLNGGADYVLSYTTSPIYHQIAEQNDNYAAASFNNGHVAQIEVAAISRYSENTALAQEFLKFLTSEQAQQIIPVTNWMLPVIDQVDLPDEFSTVQPGIMSIDPAEVDKMRKKWIRAWRTAVAG